MMAFTIVVHQDDVRGGPGPPWLYCNSAIGRGGRGRVIDAGGRVVVVAALSTQVVVAVAVLVVIVVTVVVRPSLHNCELPGEESQCIIQDKPRCHLIGVIFQSPSTDENHTRPSGKMPAG